VSRIAPRWVRAVQRALLAKPRITALPVCQACARSMAPVDMRGSLCRDCTTERDGAFDDALGSGPFMPWDDDD
jgi:hypothetical protein